MSSILLRDILISARQECVQMRHFYIGVEHLFIALLQIQGGLASSILEAQGLTSDYVIDAIRRKTDKGTSQVLWVGIPYTPRTDIVLNIANDVAADNGHEEVSERDLLCAILDEGESLPIRVLKTLKVNTDQLAESARTYTPDKEPQPPDIRVIFGTEFAGSDPIQRDQLFVLRRMFASHSQIRIERRLTGFRDALILVVTPIHPDNREDAPIVVKIDQTDNILDEVQRYAAHVKNALPLQTARLEDTPTTPEASELAGIKYTLVANSEDVPQDLRNRVQLQGAEGMGELIREGLYSRFNKTWWRQRRRFRFQVWQEYDWLLPPTLILDLLPDNAATENADVIKVPFNRAKLKTKLKELQFGDMIALENFTVQRAEREQNILKLAIGFGNEADKRAYKIEVKGVDRAAGSYYRGEVIERLVGTVWKTRHDLLLDAARALEPDFDVESQWIPVGKNQLPNPLAAYEDLLDRHVNGSLSKIHGDLHLGNILVGPNNSTWLIDFAHTRDGHTLFDWATLEVSLLGDAVMRLAGDSWEAARKIVTHVAALDTHSTPTLKDAKLTAAIASIETIREIARDCLTEPDNWYEYYVALALCSLRATTWPLMSLGGRRVMFLLAGLAIFELNRKSGHGSAGETPSPDETDMTDHLPYSVSWEAANGIMQPTGNNPSTLQNQKPVQIDSSEQDDAAIAPETLDFEEDEFPQETAASIQPIDADTKPGSDSP